MIKLEELKTQIEDIGYIATEELIYDTFNFLDMMGSSTKNVGQDIMAMCLEGPPGAGKTEFAKTYYKLVKKIFNSDTEFVEYQCDATTGKTELFEDINISAAIRHDAEHVNIPGKLVDAIKKVNEGKKVILFIDEYDKAREETDAFLLDFLQSGKINTNQHGDLKVKDEYKTNLQVFLCKNDMREELSGPLSRRIRITRLDYMTPETFYKIANRELIEKKEENAKLNEGLLNLVTLMYQYAYKNKDMYNRLPACSEMLIALQDADRLMKKANAPKYIIYSIIIKNMFKSVDDITTFEQSMKKAGEDGKKLSDLITSMQENPEDSESVDINKLIAQKILQNETKEVSDKIQELQNLIDEYRKRFSAMEQSKQAIDLNSTNSSNGINKIMLSNGKLIADNNFPNVQGNFQDESSFIKRGQNIFNLSDSDWTEVAKISLPNLSHSALMEGIIDNIAALGINVYENGILLNPDANPSLIAVKSLDDNDYYIYSSTPIIPSTYLSEIREFTHFLKQILLQQTRTLTNNVGTLDINTLIYNDTLLADGLCKLEEINNVYNFNYQIRLDNPGNVIDVTFDELDKILEQMVCEDNENAIIASNNITKSKKKVLKK